ncbi:PspC domain-containing protein [Acidipila rosea]|uniref:Phage shock protein C (PspC) family protein n=1 Tax=Acidipila rosea TaxID=768535 RepID=A0A4R1L5V9_9BACT|nr:PspC domain-containing protein [Acidipila rosea]MBW4026650.1 PspC domain-containing protein [Acidobacteriota bacterium]MBW4044826.1 PspC domain-containing protein [Acidobacteriota bacterium]TCK73532.1 phage shock protein C (PspC) family protein [Acidipila rosea]
MAIYCSNCGKAMGDDARFCSACGAQITGVAPAPMPFAQTRMYRPRAGRMVAGVCQGLAVTYHWDVVWVRVLTVLITIFSSGAGLIAYVIFWIVMPEEPYALPPTATTSYPASGGN